MTELREWPHPAALDATMPQRTSARLRYMPQLDALRGFAILAVLFQHFYGSQIGIDLPIGEWGVQLFFVLSGFLITGILLNCRDSANQGRTERKLQLRQFYIRRALRILPLFYLVVLGAALINIRPLRQDLFWHLSYASNIMLALKGSWAGPASHLWSLAVEEQFYLLWPWLILWLPTRYLKPAIVLTIALAPLYKAIGYGIGLNPVALYVLTIACLDALGIGALLALYRHHNLEIYEDLTRDEPYSWLAFAAGCGAIISCVFWQNHYFVQVAGTASATLFFAWLIHRASVGIGGAAGSLLTWKPLLYLGQISYGLYLFHKFMSIIVPRAFGALRLPFPQEPATQALLMIALTIAVASVSWFVFERPINNLKKRFKYSAS